MNKTSTGTRFLEDLTSFETLFMEVGTDRLRDQDIFLGDLVMVDPRRKAKPGDVVVREEDGEWKLAVAKGEGVEWKVIWVLRAIGE